MDFAEKLAQEFDSEKWKIDNIITLIDEGNTIPFISRYRKESHGSLDDQTLRKINDRLLYLRNLEERKTAVYELISSLQKMTPQIQKALEAATTLTEVEDIYRPYKPKRKTRASVAVEKGLEPLADEIFKQLKDSKSPKVLAQSFVSSEKDVNSVEDALCGASDIIAEKISDDASLRKRLRNVFLLNAILCAKASKKEEDSVYSMYYEYQEPLSKIASHRVLAINRGEKEGFLKVSVDFPQPKAEFIIDSIFLKEGSPCTQFVKNSSQDAYTRLIFPSIEREIRSLLKENAEKNAISLFSANLKELLMQPPIKGQITMGLDPGFRTGCKVAVVDDTGKVLNHSVVYPTHSQSQIDASKKTILGLILKHNVNVIAIGNGTASRETEKFVSDLIKEASLKNVAYVIVNESGASVYSASVLAAKEFPEYDVTIRSAISIARRLQDPLAELVKIDPKSIGVGQYQHDMPQKQLSQALDGVVEDSVNSVGVDLNTASVPLLSRISGLSKTICQNIVSFREENGKFKKRAELKKVSKLGPKAYQQCVGFIRVPESPDVFDNTGVHPESYEATTKLLEFCGYKKEDVKRKNLQELQKKVEEQIPQKLCAQIGVGEPTLKDIVKELVKPGRDPRDELPAPILRQDVLSIEDLYEGMELLGTVRNVIDFGAFVDIGVHQDGLLHISEIGNKFVKHPLDVLKLGDIIKVKVVSVDPKKKRISLSRKGL